MRFLVYPYSLRSQSAKILASKLETIRVKEIGKYLHKPGDLIINWGNKRIPNWGTKLAIQSMLNKPQYIINASEKLRTFKVLSTSDLGEHLPDWTTDLHTAQGWLEAPCPYYGLKHAVICRTLTKANSGRGIVLANTPEELVNAPLFTRYKPKQEEYRIHVHIRFGIMDAQQKRRENGAMGDLYIRSRSNGWVFCRENLKIPTIVEEVSEMAVHRLGLDFGAVDVGYHQEHGLSLYEINTAPGIEGQTLTNYANTFRRYLSS